MLHPLHQSRLRKIGSASSRLPRPMLTLVSSSKDSQDMADISQVHILLNFLIKLALLTIGAFSSSRTCLLNVTSSPQLGQPGN